MKKTLIKILSLVLVTVMAVCFLACCGDIKSGKYYYGDKDVAKTYTLYEFKGDDFTKTYYVSGKKDEAKSFSGTYEVEDGHITFTWTADGEEKTDTYIFEETEAGVKIGIFEYKYFE